MSDRELEHIYWNFCRFFMLLSAWALYTMTKSPIVLAWQPRVFQISLALCIPGTILITTVLALIKGGKLNQIFCLIKPSVSSQNSVIGSPPDACIQEIGARLQAHQFEIRLAGTPGEAQIFTYSKEKAPKVHMFLDHSLFGTIQVTPTRSAVEITSEVTFNDTVIVETGELTKLQALADYLSLKSADFTYQNVPFTLYCGLNIAFASTIMLLLHNSPLHLKYGYAFSAAGAAAGMILIVLAQTLNDRKHVFGYRLGFAGLYLAALPYLAMVLSRP